MVDFVRAAWETQPGVTSDAIPILLRATEAMEGLDPEIGLRLLLAAMMVMSLAGQRVSRAELALLARFARRTSPQADAALASVVEVNAWLAGRATTPAPRLPDGASTLVERLDDPVLAPFAVPVFAYLGRSGHREDPRGAGRAPREGP